MEFAEVIRRRRMVRNFEDRPLPPSVVDELLLCARRGPSAGFTQGIEFLVLEGREQTSRYWNVSLSEAQHEAFRWPGLLHAPLLIVPFADKEAYLDRYAEPDKGWTDLDESRWSAPYWIVDTAFATMLILLAAVDAGLGALFFGVFHPEEVKAEFGVPARLQPIGALAVGYPAPDKPSESLKRGRRPAADVIHRGGWS